MTDAKRGAMLLLLGLFTAVLLYPALHEGGHILVTLLLGGRIREVRLGAAASVLCGGLRHGELAAVAFGGVGLPLALAMLLRPKHFPLWYVVQLVKGISVLAILLSLISLIGCKYGVIVENDDIMNAVRLWPEGRGAQWPLEPSSCVERLVLNIDEILLSSTLHYSDGRVSCQ